MPRGTTFGDQFVTDELVAAIPHQRLVLGELAALSHTVTNAKVTKSNATLGLCLISVTHVRPDTDGADALTALICAIRRRCADRYGGWQPTIGKNRMLIGVRGVGDPKASEDQGVPSSHGDRGRDVKVSLLGEQPYPTDLVKQRAPLAELDSHAPTNPTCWDLAVSIAGSDADVLNVSMGCFTDDGAPPLLLRQAVDVLGPHTVVVAPAGDHGQALPLWPAALDNVVGVGARDSAGNRAKFSPDAPWVTLSAPGVDAAGENVTPGTACAAAMVTGEIAAGTVPGKRDAREALNDLLRQSPGQGDADIWAYDYGLIT